MKKNLLIIGGNSYIGSLLIQKLLKKNEFNIYSTFFKNPKFDDNINNIYLNINKFKKKDLVNFPKKIDNMIVLSWCKLNDYNSTLHIKFSKNLMNFSKLLLNYSNISSINVLGSCLEYGVVSGKIHENSSCLPVTNYGKSKLDYLNELKKLKSKFKFKLIWMRVFYIYGDVRDRGIWSQFLRAKNNNEIFKMSEGNQKFDFIHIKKLINFLNNIVTSNRSLGIVNLCSGRPKKLINLVKSWSLKYNVRLQVGFYPYTKYESMAYWGSNDKLIRFLNSYGKSNKKI